jgi:ATP-binding cassette subfamily B protein
MKIDLQSFPQEKNATCLPACLRIVLHYFGVDMSEEALAEACQTNREGTSIEMAAQAMRSQRFEAIELNEADLFTLVEHVVKGRPVIVALDVGLLPYGESGMHAVTICGFENNEVQYIDPGLGQEISLDLFTFFKSWDSLGRSGLVFYPKSSS